GEEHSRIRCGYCGRRRYGGRNRETRGGWRWQTNRPRGRRQRRGALLRDRRQQHFRRKLRLAPTPTATPTTTTTATATATTTTTATGGWRGAGRHWRWRRPSSWRG